MAKIMYEIHTSLLDSVQKVADAVTKNFQALTGGKEVVSFGYKIGSVTAEIKDDEAEKVFRKEFIDEFTKLWKEKGFGGKIWLTRAKGGN